MGSEHPDRQERVGISEGRGGVDSSEIQFRIQKLIYENDDLLEIHDWPSEYDRWVELVYTLLTRVEDIPQSEVREAVDTLDALGLLEVETFREQSEGADAERKRRKEVLEEAGFSPEGAEKGVVTLTEMATSLQQQYDGKVQRFLRDYGEQMVTDAIEQFSFSEIDRSDVDYAFRFWLQNVSNMPVHLPLEEVDTFTDENDITHDDLVSIADGIDLNIALLDDIIAREVTSEPAED